MTDNGPGNDPDNGAAGDDRPAPGNMRFQDGSTTPREPTLGERKARERVTRRRQEEADRLQEQADERSARQRKRILIGSSVTVGLVAVIAIGYAMAQPDEDVQAQCVDPGGLVVDDSNCVTPAANTTHYGGGGGFFPIFIGGGGRQYHYNYGGSGGIGQPVSGGTTTVPRDGVRVSTPSGKTVAGTSNSGSVSRGGLGSSGSGSSSGS